MFHWCQDETNALLIALPFLGIVITWIKVKWKAIADWITGRDIK
jgi:hypothetical protein